MAGLIEVSSRSKEVMTKDIFPIHIEYLTEKRDVFSNYNSPDLNNLNIKKAICKKSLV